MDIYNQLPRDLEEVDVIIAGGKFENIVKKD